MATSVGALYYDLTVDDSGVDAGLNRADSKLANFQDKMQKVGQGMSDVGKKMTMGLTLPIVGLGVAGVKMASDLNETVNKVNVAFGESASKVQEWGNTTLKNLGLAKGSALDAAALFGDMATSMGLPQQAAADMSMSMVGLGADLASFKNISFEEAQTALAGIFTGETESLKRLGVVMTQTQLDAFALAQGIGKTTSEMSQAELVNLRYAFVMDKTKNAQGDFARTSDGTANQLRIMQETFKETSATIGQNLLPIVTKIAGKVAEWTKKFAELSPQTQKVILIIAAIVAVMGPLLIVIGQLIMAIRAISMAFSFLAMNPIVLAVIAIIIVIAALAFLIIKNWDTLKQWFATFWNWLTSVAKAVWDGIVAAVKWVVDLVIAYFTLWFNFYKFIFETIWAIAQAVWNGIVAAVQWVVNAIIAYFQFWYNIISGIFNAVWGAIKWAFENAWNFVKGIWNGVTGFFRNVIDGISGVFGNVVGIVTSPFKAAFNGIANLWNNSIGKLSFTAPDWVPGIGGKGFSMPKLPLLAQGGIANSATAAIFGEAGTEAVLPLNYLNRYSDLFDRIEATANKVSGNQMTDKTPIVLNLNLDGIMTESREGTRGVARTLIGAINEELRAKGKQELAI